MENWKVIEGFEGIYEVSNYGNVRSIKRGIILKPCKTGRGYIGVVLNNKGCKLSISVHKLVAMAFLNHRRCGMKEVINHIDFDKTNNNVENLEITTQRKNVTHTLKKRPLPTGVYKYDKKYRVIISINGVQKHLGIFFSEKEAEIAYHNAVNNASTPENKQYRKAKRLKNWCPKKIISPNT